MSYYQSVDGGEPVYLFGQGGGKRLAEEIGAPFLGQVPLDPFICSCSDRGQSLFSADPEGKRPATQAFLRLAKELVEQTASLKTEKKAGLGSFELEWKEMN